MHPSKFRPITYLFILCLLVTGCGSIALFFDVWKTEYAGPPFWERLIVPSLARILGDVHEGPFNSNEIVDLVKQGEWNFPIYVPSSPDGAGQVGPIFYLIGTSEELFLETVIFPPKNTSIVERIAVLRTFSRMPSDGEATNSIAVPLMEFNQAVAQTCSLTPYTTRQDRFPGKAYQTCLQWHTTENYFLLYSTLPLDETADLARTLRILAKKR